MRNRWRINAGGIDLEEDEPARLRVDGGVAAGGLDPVHESRIAVGLVIAATATTSRRCSRVQFDANGKPLCRSGGVATTAFGVWLLYRIDPESPRYMILTAARLKGLPKPYLKNYLRDQQLRTLVVLAGTVVQGIAVVMAFWAD